MHDPYFDHTIGVSLQYLNLLVKDIPQDQLADQPHGLVNHPAWVLGHVAATADRVAVRLGQPSVLPEDWQPIFGKGSKPVADVNAYPTKETLLNGLKDSHESLLIGFHKATPESLATPNKEMVHPWFPTIGAGAHMVVVHNATHAGQISAWRRIKGFAAMF